MKAIIFDKELKFDNNFPKPQPEKGEALIRVLMAGICNTDLEITKGYMGFSGVLGHEFVGIVEEINHPDKSLLNKRVVGEINCACNICELCKDNLQTHCNNRSVLGIFNRNGCFAEYITLPVENLLEVPDNVSDEEAVFTEPIAAGFEILEQIHIKPTDKLLVMGDGKLGLLISYVLKSTQTDLTLVGKHESKLNLAKVQGIKTMLLENLEVKKNYDVVVEATGSINGFELAQNLVKPRGTIVLKSTVAGEKNFNLAPLVIDEISLIGSRCGPFEPAIRALENKNFDAKPLISAVFKPEQAVEAFEHSKQKGVLKVLLDFK